LIKISKLTGPGLAIALTFIASCKSRVSEDFSLLADVEFSSVYESSKPRKCEASKATMFKNSTSELEKPITIKGNVTDIFKNAKPQFAVIMDHRASSDARRFVPVYIENRGNTRGTDCEIKPVRIKFMLHPSDAELKAKLALRRDNWKATGITSEEHSRIISSFPQGSSNDQKLQLYYDAFIASQNGRPAPENGFSQDKDSFFGQMGDDVKLVTHCGKAEWEELSALTYKLQRERLLNEFYIYRILNELKTVIIKISLLGLTYEEARSSQKLTFDGQTNVIGFLRESRSKLASRCGLNEEPLNASPDVDIVSETQTKLFNQFVLSLDYNFNQAQSNRNSHNIEILYDPKGNKKVYSSYDFDLNGIWKEHYDLPEDTYKDSARKFGVFLGTYVGNPIMIPQVTYLLSKLEKIKQKIATAEKVINANANEKEKKFVAWIAEFEPILYEFINLNRKDHGALIDAIRASQMKSKANDSPLDRDE
jgi:hypothetical protein